MQMAWKGITGMKADMTGARLAPSFMTSRAKSAAAAQEGAPASGVAAEGGEQPSAAAQMLDASDRCVSSAKNRCIFQKRRANAQCT